MARKPSLRKPKNRYHHGDLRAAMISAGREILAKDGLEALTLRAVARRVSVSQSAPYKHFTDKRALLDAIATTGYNELGVRQRRGFASTEEPLARINAMGQEYVGFASENPALYQLMMSWTLPEQMTDPAMRSSWFDNVAVVQKAAMQVIGPNPTPKQAAASFVAAWAVVHGLSELIIKKRVSPEMLGMKDLDDLVAHVLQVLRPPA